MPHDARAPGRHARRRALGRGGSLLPALAIAALWSLAACGDNNPTPTPPPTTIPTVAPTASPTASPTPVDVTPDFIRIIASPAFSATADISGTVSLGGVTGDLTGRAVMAGPNSSQTLTINIGGTSRQTDSVSIGSKHWNRSAPGPWLAAPDADPSRGSLSGTFTAIASVEDLGVVPKAGRKLHRLRPAGGGQISPAAIGFEVEGATDAAFGMDFYTTDDGTPAILGINGSWTQTEGDAAVVVDIDIEFALDDIGKAQAVSPPEDVWSVHTSNAYGYSMAHPADWTVEASKTQDEFAIDGQPYVFVAPQKLARSLSLDSFAVTLEDTYQDDFGQPISRSTRSLGGQPASRLLYRFMNDQGQSITFVDDVTVRGRTGWEVYFLTAGGAEDIPIFDQFAATFRFTD